MYSMTRFLLAFALVLFPLQAFALSSDWKTDEAVSVRLISGAPAVGNAATVPLGIEVKLANGWHTYWRSPGQAGLPPYFDWSRSETEKGNLRSASVLFPAPRRETIFRLETIGYRDHVVLPIDVTLINPGKALNAEVSIDLLACFSTCVPKHFDLSLTVPEGASAPDADGELLQKARDEVPTNPDDAGILLSSVTGEGNALKFTIHTRGPIDKPDIFIENDKNIDFGAPTIESATPDSAVLKVSPVDNLSSPDALTKLPLTLTIVNGNQATEIRTVTPEAFAPITVFAPPKIHLGLALLFALIGGFILNLMPCVLPVLSLKIVSVVSHGGGEEGRVRHSFLVTAAGILFSFLLLAAATVLLKRLDLAFGWGVQFQQPAFLMFLVLLLAFFAANLWGFYEIALPQFLADKMDKTYHPKLAGDFATGAFATLLATPCSAPFLGTAVGFALGAGARQIILIFLALGFGMALPYFIIALFPRLATRLPKPGAWMVHLKQFLGVALALTALWLIWVLSSQVTLPVALTFALMMAAAIGMLALNKHCPSKLTKAALVCVCLCAFIVGLNGARDTKTQPHAGLQWLDYSPRALDADIAEGKTVFLDVTADWCITCKANKKFALADSDVVQRLFHSEVVAMQADWTSPDPAVTALLQKYGRYGIPFNAVFGPAAPQGIVLPELLTPGLVLKALDAASGVK